jgi:hypothetical protein
MAPRCTRHFFKGESSMNRKQMIVLISTAIAVIIVLITAPEVYILPSKHSDNSQHLLRYNSPPARYANSKPTIDLAPTLIRVGIAIITGSVILYILKDKKVL